MFRSFSRIWYLDMNTLHFSVYLLAWHSFLNHDLSPDQHGGKKKVLMTIKKQYCSKLRQYLIPCLMYIQHHWFYIIPCGLYRYWTAEDYFEVSKEEHIQHYYCNHSNPHNQFHKHAWNKIQNVKMWIIWLLLVWIWPECFRMSGNNIC